MGENLLSKKAVRENTFSESSLDKNLMNLL